VQRRPFGSQRETARRLAAVATGLSIALLAAARAEAPTAATVTLEISGRREPWQVLEPGGAPVAVSVSAQPYLVLEIRAEIPTNSRIAEARVDVERDGVQVSKNELRLTADIGQATAGGRPLSQAKLLVVPVPAGKHAYRIAVGKGSAAIVVRATPGTSRLGAEVVNPEELLQKDDLDLLELPLEPLPTAVVTPAPGPVIEVVTVAAPDAGPAPAGAPAVAPDQEKHGVILALRLGVLIPTGSPADAVSEIGALAPTGHRTATLPLSLLVGYRLPWLGRDLAVTGEVGWYHLAAKGSRAFPQDPDFTALAYAWTAQHVPLQLGFEYRLPLGLAPLSLHVDASFAAVWSTYTTTYTAENVTDAAQKGWALGFGVGGGAAYVLGPGEVTFDVRYLNARTDLRLPAAYPGQPWNARKGDVQGTNLLVGYRLAL
jgi:hypothetical protein